MKGKFSADQMLTASRGYCPYMFTCRDNKTLTKTKISMEIHLRKDAPEECLREECPLWRDCKRNATLLSKWASKNSLDGILGLLE